VTTRSSVGTQSRRTRLCRVPRISVVGFDAPLRAENKPNTRRDEKCRLVANGAAIHRLLLPDAADLKEKVRPRAQALTKGFGSSGDGFGEAARSYR
jgi:predicted nuclease with RNAse H fold